MCGWPVGGFSSVVIIWKEKARDRRRENSIQKKMLESDLGTTETMEVAVSFDTEIETPIEIGKTVTATIAKDRVFNDFFLFRYIISYLPDQTSPVPYPLFLLKWTFRCLLSIPTISSISQYGFSISQLQWLRESHQTKLKIFTSKVFTKLTSYASIEVLDWFLLQHNTITTSALNTGNYNLSGLLSSPPPPPPLLTPLAPVTAIKYHRLEIIEWLEYHNCPVDTLTCATAALDSTSPSTSLELLSYLRDRPNPFPWSSDTCHNAALVGNLSLLQWLTQQDPPCPISAGTFSNAAYGGHLPVLEWVVAINPRPENWDLRLYSSAARGGHLHILKWIYQRQMILTTPLLIPWDEIALTAAASRGHLHVFQWAEETNETFFTWNTSAVIDAAAYGGHLCILQYVELKRRGEEEGDGRRVDWSSLKRVCHRAVAGGHLPVLQWLRSREPPCPWDEDVYLIAKSQKHMKLLAWLDTQPRPLS
jgi:hypothetical protein